jgi:hypothetical protein
MGGGCHITASRPAMMLLWILHTVDTIFIRINDTHIPALVYEWHPDIQKKRRSTKEKMERTTPLQTEQAWNGLCPVADDALSISVPHFTGLNPAGH